MNDRESGECSMSIHKDLLFGLESKMMTQKKNCLCQTIFVPPSYVVAGAQSGALYRWTIPEKITEISLRPAWSNIGHRGYISVMHWSDSLKLLFTGSADKCVMVWRMNARTPKDTCALCIPTFSSTPIALLTYAHYLFVCETSGITVLMYQDLNDPKEEKFIFKKLDFITQKNVARNQFKSICFSRNLTVDNSGYLYAGFENGSLLQYDAQLTDKPSFTPATAAKKISDRAIFKIKYIARENLILVFSYDRHIRIFNPRNYRVFQVLRNPQGVDFADASYDDETMQYLLADINGFLYVWEAQDMSRILLQTQFHTQCEQIVPMEGYPGKYLFLQREVVSRIEINRGTVKRSFPVHSGTVTYIASANSNNARMQLVTAGDDKMIRFWDPTDISLREEQSIPSTLPMLSVYVGARQRGALTNLIWAVTGHDEGKLFFFNITDHKQCELPSRHYNSISSIIVVENEMKVILMSCDYDGICSIWSIDSILENMAYAPVSLIKTWRVSQREVLTSAGQWMTEQPIFATGGNDKIISIWKEVDQAFECKVLKGHTDSVTALVFEGFFLISGSEDLTIRIWDTFSMVQLSVIQHVHGSAVRSILHIPRETLIASCDAGGQVLIYDYVKKKEAWSVKHSSDCKCIFVDSPTNKLFACVKAELIPHDIPDGVFKPSLPALNSKQGKFSSY